MKFLVGLEVRTRCTSFKMHFDISQKMNSTKFKQRKTDYNIKLLKIKNQITEIFWGKNASKA